MESRAVLSILVCLLPVIALATEVLLIQKYQNSPYCSNSPVEVTTVIPNICLESTMETYSCPPTLQDGAIILYTTYKDPGCEQWIKETNYTQNTCFVGSGGFTYKWTCTNAARNVAPAFLLIFVLSLLCFLALATARS